jgi:lipopolysaccharide export system protein LptA
VVMDQQTGDAVADGAVKASYLQKAGPRGAQPGDGAAEAVHVLAVRGELKHDAGVALFYGGAGHPARLWQGASQVEAPVLQFEQKERRLVARGDGPGMIVHAVFVSSSSPEMLGGASAAAVTHVSKSGPATPSVKRPVPVRVASHAMTYNDGTRRAEFIGGVLVEDSGGTMRAQQALVYLKAAPAPGTAGSPKTGTESKSGVRAKDGTQSAFMGGSVERVVVTGRVDIVQPGRRATGEQLVYTAADELFVLTGLPGLQPRMMDQTQGAITGATISFHTGDNSVVVLNGPDAATGQRVRTETRVKQ